MSLGQQDAKLIVSGRHADPFSVLGMRPVEGGLSVCAYIPGAERIDVLDAKTDRSVLKLEPVANAAGLFYGVTKRRKKPFHYLLMPTAKGQTWRQHDPYGFTSVLGELDLHLFSEGDHRRLWRAMGANLITHQGVEGTHFAVWAPNARRVSVVGDFNGWNGSTHVMRARGHTGIWELFVPGIGEGEHYKYEIMDRNGHVLPQKADPLGLGSEHPPSTASIVRRLKGHAWNDDPWMDQRAKRHAIDQPISIYEVHLGSWKRVLEDQGRSLSSLEHATQLVDYVKDMVLHRLVVRMQVLCARYDGVD